MNTDDPKSIINQSLSEAHILQLATVNEGQPWICNLHFVTDASTNIYWISKEDRRHSIELAINPKAAITLAVRTEKPLVGIQGEGSVEIVTDKDTRRTIMDSYAKHHGTDASFVDRVVDDIDAHKVYKFTPVHFTLFDQEHFASQPLQEWVIK